MSATTSGALKAYIELQGLGISAYRDRPPEGTAKPYVTLDEAITVTPNHITAQFDHSDTPVVTEEVQIDLWQTWKAADNSVGESYTLPGLLAKALTGATLPASGNGAPPTHVWGVRLAAGPRRFPDLEPNVIRHMILVHVDRDLY